jgi:hypothetical protein
VVTDDDIVLPGKPRRGGPGRGGTSARGQQEAAAVRADRALTLRSAGYSYRQIADALGYASTASAYGAVQRALERMRVTNDELREEYRLLHLERLERMFANVYPLTLRRRHPETGEWLPPDEMMIARAIRLLEREARLLGLDAPQRVAITADQQEHYLDALLELRRVLEARQAQTEAQSIDGRCCATTTNGEATRHRR